MLCTLPPKADAENHSRELQALLDASRIEAEIHVFTTSDPLWEIAKETGNTAVLFTDFDPPEEGGELAFMEEIEKLTDIPMDVILVYNAGDVELEA
ncbi:MAG: hypothetical protein ABIK28_01580 [Planctomycetota bacterium]